MKIHDQFQAWAAHPEIGQELRPMGGDDDGDRLDFRDDSVSDDVVRTDAQTIECPV
jgi:hypothetical protein